MVLQIQPRASATAEDLRRVFETVDASSCPTSLNFHMHTVYSDGRLEPEELVRQAIALGLSHFAITDHHTVGGYLHVKHLLDLHRQHCHGDTPLPRLWAGIEVNASLLYTEVHILGYGFDPQHEAMSPYLHCHTTAGLAYQAASAIDAIHQAGGLAVLAHPVRYRRSPEDLIPAAAQLGIDGVETYYGYDNCDPWRPSPEQTDRVYGLVEQCGLLHTCGTDTHGPSLTRRM